MVFLPKIVVLLGKFSFYKAKIRGVEFNGCPLAIMQKKTN